MSTNRLTMLMVVRNGQLIPATNNDRARKDCFTAQLAEGQRVEVYLSEYGPENHSLAQLAKVHALAKELADESGASKEEIKDVLKKEAGLTRIGENGEEELRSFRECSKQELSRAIQVAVRYADMLGITLPDRIDSLGTVGGFVPAGA